MKTNPPISPGESNLSVQKLLRFSFDDLDPYVDGAIRGKFEGLDIKNFVSCLKKDNDGLIFQAAPKNQYYYYRKSYSFLIGLNGDIVFREGDATSGAIALYFFVQTVKDIPRSRPGRITEVLHRLFPVSEKKPEPLKFESIVIVHEDFENTDEGENSTSKVFEEKAMIQSIYATPETKDDFALFRQLNGNPKLEDIFFNFSNGLSLSLVDFVAHPYRFVFSNIAYEVHNCIRNRKIPKRLEGLNWDDDESKLWIDYAKNNVFFSFIDEFSRKYPIFLGKIFYKGTSEWVSYSKAHKVEALDVLKDFDLAQMDLDSDLKSGEIRIVMKVSEPPPGSEKISNLFYDKTGRKIYAPPQKTSLKKLSSKLHKESFNYFVSESGPGSTSVIVENHPSPVHLKLILDELGIGLVDDTLSEQLVPVKNSLKLESDDLFSVGIDPVVSIGQDDYRVKSRSKDFEQLLSSFCLGISGIFHEEAKTLAVQNPKFRTNELRLYKHTGLVRFLAMEFLGLQEPNDEGASSISEEKAGSNGMEPKVATFLNFLFTKETGAEVQKLDAITGVYISKKCVANIRRYIANLFTIFRQEAYFLDSGSATRVKIGEAHFRIFRFVAHSLVNNTGPKGFLRAKGDDLVIDGPFVRSTFSKIRTGDRSLFELQFKEKIDFYEGSRAGKVTIADQEIQDLTAEDLSSVMEVNSIDGQIDWFELHPKYFFRGQEIESSVALQLSQGNIVEFKGNYYRVDPKNVPSMKTLERFWSRITGSKLWGIRSSTTLAEVKLERSKILDLLALKNQGVDVKGDDKWKKVSQAFDDLENLQEKQQLEIQEKLKDFGTDLRKFQLQGVNWMTSVAQLGLGCLLADDMGLGKTVQSIAFLHCFPKVDKKAPHLIVVPTSLVYNWIAEFKRFSPKMNVMSFEGKFKGDYPTEWLDNPPDVCVTTYGLLTEHPDFFLERPWTVGIFDEVQYLKNLKAKRRGVAAKLRCDHKIALTGTPLENHYGELYSVLDLCVPGALGPYSDFMSTFGSILKVDSANAEEDLTFLKKKIKPLVLRRTKNLVLQDLPEKSETVITLEFSREQAEAYKKMALAWNRQIGDLVSQRGESGAQLQMLTALLKLRQICSFPGAVDGVSRNVVSPKFKLLKENLLELTERGESAIVFTNFLSTLEELRLDLGSAGLETLRICGKDSKKKREKTLKDFNSSPKPKHLIMTLKTGGVGLNLTRANYVFHFEPWWNPAAENQGTDRVHRIGQEKGVQVYRFIMKDSVEEKIQDLKRNKQRAFDILFEEDPQKIKDALSLKNSRLTHADFEALLS